MATADARSRRRLRSPRSPSRSSSESSARTLRRRTMAPQKRGGGATVRYAFEGPRPRAFTPSSSRSSRRYLSPGARRGRCTRRRHAARAKLDRRARARGPRRRREADGRGSRQNRRDARGRAGHRTGWSARELRAGEGRAGDQVPRDAGQPQRGAFLRHARAKGFRATALGKQSLGGRARRRESQRARAPHTLEPSLLPDEMRSRFRVPLNRSERRRQTSPNLRRPRRPTVS